MLNHKYVTKLSIMTMIVALFVSFIAVAPNTTHAASSSTIKLKAKSSILVDADSGKVLFEKNADEALPPASMTKMMTEYLVLEAINKGKIKWNTTTQISDYAYSISGNAAFSGVGLTQNKDYTVKELYKAMAINSDNGTSIALAELVGGSEGDFVKMMNKKAKQMKLPDYKFVNSSGLDNESLGKNYPKGTEPDDVDLLSARSAALLAYHLVNEYPEALEYSGMPKAKFEDQTITNWNWMLQHHKVNFDQYYYEGVDGLKTGHTDLAGYCFTATAERSGHRLISVVMKTNSEDTRFKETGKLLDYGYSQFFQKNLFPKGYQLKSQKTLPVSKGKEDTVSIATDNDFKVMLKKGEEKKYKVKYHLDKHKLNDDNQLIAPVKKGEKVGTAEIVYDGKDLGFVDGKKSAQIDLVATKSVEKSNWFMLALGGLGDFFTNIFSSLADMVKGWFS